MTLVLLALCAVVLLTAQAVYYSVLYAGTRRQNELRRRLRALGEDGRSANLLRTGRMARSRGLARMVGQLPFAHRLEELLLQTDLQWTVARMLGTGLGVGVALAAGLAILLPGPSLIVLVIVPLSVGAPILFAVAARQRRSDKISEQLPDALDMMVRSLRAGHGVSAGFRLVASEMPTPIAIEFARCFEEQQAGASRRDAVRNMSQRVPGNLDLRIFATSLIIQHDTGGNLVEILDSIATTVRNRYKFYGKLRALTSEARMSGRILGALPIVCALAVALLNFQYMAPLFTELLGQVILLGGMVFWVAGIVWMRKLAKVAF